MGLPDTDRSYLLSEATSKFTPMDMLTRLARGTRWERLVLAPIETRRLRIVPLVVDEADDVRRITDDPAITGAVEFLPPHVAIEDAQGLISAARSGRDVFLGLRERQDGALVGVVGAHLRALNAIEIGYWIGGSARGRGYAAEGVGAVVRVLAKDYTRRAVVAECRPDNAASWQLLHKLGFRPTGDGGHRPGRVLLVWDIRGTSRDPPTAATLASRRGASARPATGEEPF